MALPKCTTVRRPICTLVAGAVVFAALAATTAGASAQSPAVHSVRLSVRPRRLPHDRPAERSCYRARPLRHQRTWPDRGRVTSSTPASRVAFVRDGRGRFTEFDVPGARATQAHKINNRGQIVGSYSEERRIVNDNAKRRGFLLDKGRFTRIDVPGRSADAGLRHQQPRPGRGRVHRRRRHGPRLPVGQGSVHDLRRAGRHRGVLFRYQRPRPDRRHLWRPQRAGKRSTASC